MNCKIQSLLLLIFICCIGLSSATVNITINSPDDNSVLFNPVNFNCSISSTEFISNISLWSNSSGSWNIEDILDFENNGWIIDSNIIDGLGFEGSYSTPDVFYKDSNLYMISGKLDGFFRGFNWTGSTWQTDNNIKNGLVINFTDQHSSPSIFYKDSNLYIIVGITNGNFYGFNWTGSTWQIDSNIVSGLGDIGGFSNPSVFYKDSELYLISGVDSGIIHGFNWTGSTWQTDNNIINGVGSIGGGISDPDVFYKESELYMIIGRGSGDFIGFNWTGSTWQTDSNIVSGLGDIGTAASPSIFYKDSNLYMISGNSLNANWDGWNFTDYKEYTNIFSVDINDTILLSCSSCDILGSCNFTENRTIVLFNINITNPLGELSLGEIGESVDLNWSLNSYSLPEECWYNYNGTNITLNCSSNYSSFNLIDNANVDGIFNLTFYANNSEGLVNSQITTWGYQFFESAFDFDEIVYETETSSFYINMTTAIDVLSVDAFIVYDEETYPASASCIGGNCQISSTIDVGLISNGGSEENKTFYWIINIYDGTSRFTVTTSGDNQTVREIILSECGGIYNTTFMNFTSFDETTLDDIISFNFDGTFEFWLGGGTFKKNVSISKSNVNHVALCLLPLGETYFTDANIEYNEYNTDNYTKRNWYWQSHSISNRSENISLGLLQAIDSTSFVLRVQDNNLLPIDDLLIYTERWYPGLGEYKVVQVAKTDNEGKSIGFFITETVDYRFVLKINDTIYLTTERDKVIGLETPYTLSFTIEEEIDNPWTSFDSIPNFQSQFSFNKTAKTITWTYIDSSGIFDSSRIYITKQNWASGQLQIACLETSVESSFSIVCDISNSTYGTYIIQTYVTRNGDELPVENFPYKYSSSNDDLDTKNYKMFFGIFILILCATGFLGNEIVGIWIMNAGIIFVNFIGLIDFGYVFIGGSIFVSLIAIVVLDKRSTF